MTATPTRARSLVAGLSLIVLGAAGGIAADRLLHGSRGDSRSEFLRFHDEPFAVLDSALSFRPDQHEAIRVILEARQHDVDQVWRDTHSRLLAILDSAMSDLEAVLDPAQVERLQGLADVLHGRPAGLLPH